MEYAWFNNVESKPGIGYPKEWENQVKWKVAGFATLTAQSTQKSGGKFRILANIFANPDLPSIDDYYEPFDFDYQHLHRPISEHQPIARPRSLITGKRMQKSNGVPTGKKFLVQICQTPFGQKLWQRQTDIYGQYENTFMMYLPRLCEHCLNPACVCLVSSGGDL